LRECTFGDTTSDTTVVLIGDSHAAQWVPSVEEIAQGQHWRLVTMLKVSCPVADVRSYNVSVRGVEEQCQTWRKTAISRIQAMQPRYVLIGETDDYVVNPFDTGHGELLPISTWQDGLHRSLSSIMQKASGRNVFIMRDTPRMARQVPECLSQAALHPWFPYPSCNTPRSVSVSEQVFSADRKAAEGVPGARLLDLTEQFCDATTCYAERNGTVRFFDNNHVTATYAQAIAHRLLVAMQ
jgi:hypothetical protein